MPKVRTKLTKTPAGWDIIEPTLNDLERKMRDGAYARARPPTLARMSDICCTDWFARGRFTYSLATCSFCPTTTFRQLSLERANFHFRPQLNLKVTKASGRWNPSGPSSEYTINVAGTSTTCFTRSKRSVMSCAPIARQRILPMRSFAHIGVRCSQRR